MRKQLKTCSRICPAAHGWDWGLLLELGEALDNLLKDHCVLTGKKKKKSFRWLLGAGVTENNGKF